MQIKVGPRTMETICVLKAEEAQGFWERMARPA